MNELGWALSRFVAKKKKIIIISEIINFVTSIYNFFFQFLFTEKKNYNFFKKARKCQAQLFQRLVLSSCEPAGGPAQRCLGPPPSIFLMPQLRVLIQSTAEPNTKHGSKRIINEHVLREPWGPMSKGRDHFTLTMLWLPQRLQPLVLYVPWLYPTPPAKAMEGKFSIGKIIVGSGNRF